MRVRWASTSAYVCHSTCLAQSPATGSHGRAPRHGLSALSARPTLNASYVVRGYFFGTHSGNSALTYTAELPGFWLPGIGYTREAVSVFTLTRPQAQRGGAMRRGVERGTASCSRSMWPAETESLGAGKLTTAWTFLGLCLGERGIGNGDWPVMLRRVVNETCWRERSKRDSLSRSFQTRPRAGSAKSSRPLPSPKKCGGPRNVFRILKKRIQNT